MAGRFLAGSKQQGQQTRPLGGEVAKTSNHELGSQVQLFTGLALSPRAYKASHGGESQLRVWGTKALRSSLSRGSH